MTRTKSQEEQVVASAISLALFVVFFPVAAMGQPTSPLEKAKLAGNEVIETPSGVGRIELSNNYFDAESSKRLFDEMDYQRAAQAYIWSTPLVSMTTWRNQQTRSYGATNETDFVVLRSLKEKRGIVTANLTTPYTFNFISLKAGPLLIH